MSAKDDPLLVAPWDMPEPLLPVAIVAKTRSDEDALAKNLARLVAGDPTHAAGTQPRDPPAGAVVHGRGARRRGARPARARGGVELEHRAGPGVAARDVRRSAEGHGRHVKQSGGHGQYAVCDIEVEPLPRGAGFEFVDKVVGGAVPHNYIPSVEKGVRAQMERGIVAGYPVVDLRVTLVDGKAHSRRLVRRRVPDRRRAGAEGRRREGPGRPCWNRSTRWSIRVPDEFVGAVMSDLSGRRGRVLGTEPDPAGTERTLVRAEVPATELVRYAVELRSMTSGTGTFARRFARHEPMPGTPGRPGPQGARRHH